AGAPGNVLVPDSATDLGKITNGGKTYTYKIKQGVKFGPPLNRQITSADFKYAMDRIKDPKLAAGYAFYYSEVKSVSTPDPSTVVYHLTKPIGDFRLRLGLPAAGPIPKEVAGCFTDAAKYGRFVISSGPYMIEGSDKLDASSCDKVVATPLSGFDGEKQLTLVRNPAYDPKTDSRKARENFPDSFTWTVNTNTEDIYARVARGDIEDEIANEPPTVLRQYQGSDQLKINNGDRTQYITMNTTQPPFDDVHVRRAANFVMDREGLRKAYGGPTAGIVATHVAPDSILNDKLKGYAPYGGPRGDVNKAKAEMKLSKYDTNKDGLCDAKACQNVFTIQGDGAVRSAMVPVAEASMKKIGISLKTRILKDAYTPIQTPSQNVPFALRPSWGKDYADATTFYGPLFDGRNIIAKNNTNYSLLGITAATAKKVGAKGNIAAAPSVNADLDKCAPLVEERVACYAALDKKLTTKIVPWIPYLWLAAPNVISKNVTKWGFDQFSTTIAYAHVAVK
ncbi:MAG: peptide/nickel transport system substrate-binding protein, partial [Gaiellales bacterium]|nr:peptide/nickel transport system substrate-binding protein [Gaiellales bacterium]